VTAAPGPHGAAGAAGAVEAVRLLAACEPLLLALDFDGVCAPLVDDPTQSRMLPGTRTALEALAAAGCQIALVSGRALASLRAAADPAPGWLLVGGHGAEVGDGDGSAPLLTEDELQLLGTVTAEVDAVVQAHPGTTSEHKPTGVVLHTRLAEEARSRAAVEAVTSGPGARPGVHQRTGHDVVELMVVVADKGSAVQALQARTDATSVLYVGDDVTDEDAFRALDPLAGDVGVKVGPGDTAAGYRVAAEADVTRLLEELLAARLQP